MEYIGNCPKCKHHTIVKSLKTIRNATRKPQRTEKCLNCGATARITIIGEIVKFARSTGAETGEYNPELNSYSLKVQLWK